MHPNKVQIEAAFDCAYDQDLPLEWQMAIHSAAVEVQALTPIVRTAANLEAAEDRTYSQLWAFKRHINVARAAAADQQQHQLLLTALHACTACCWACLAR